jgi:hypothetical protein
LTYDEGNVLSLSLRVNVCPVFPDIDDKVSAMATAGKTLQATLRETEFGALRVLARSTFQLSGRKVAAGLGLSATTANDALSTMFCS